MRRALQFRSFYHTSDFVFPKLKLFVGVFFCIGAFLPSSYSDPNGDWKKDIEALRVAMDCPDMTIRMWNGEIVVNTIPKPDGIYTSDRLLAPLKIGVFYSFTADALDLKALVVPGLEQIVSVGEASGTPFALGKAKNGLLLMRKEGAIWKEMPDLPQLQSSKDPRIIPSTKGLAILSQDDLFRFSEGKWLPPIQIPPKVNLPDRYMHDRWNQKQVLYDSQLFVGWHHDVDSDDGMLALLDVNDTNAKWVQINGKEDPTIQGILGTGPVTDMAMDGEKHLWISADYQAEGESMRRGIFRYDGSKWFTVVNSHYEGTWKDFTQPRRPHFGSGRDGKLYAVDSHCGILAFENGKFRRQIAIGLYDEIKKTVTDPYHPVSAGIYSPVANGLVIDAAGNAFVTTEDNFGVLCFLKVKKHYSLRQVVPPGTKFFAQ